MAIKSEAAVASLANAEHGHLITIVKYMNTAGRYVTHVVIFPRKNMQVELTDATPPESIYVGMDPD
jgi:hypothetical protein